MADKVRVDKWLWSVRIFKTRSTSTKECKAGRVKLGDKILKASQLIQVGDKILVHKNGFNLFFEVTALISKRVSATLAQACYVDLTPDAELLKYQDWFIGKGRPEFRPRGDGRPTKKERRSLDSFKEIYLETDFKNE